MVRAKAYGYYGGGIKVHRKLLPWLYVETGISYISGKAPFELVEEKTDFIGTAYPTNYTRFTTMMNTTQFEIGIQFRLGKDMK